MNKKTDNTEKKSPINRSLVSYLKRENGEIDVDATCAAVRKVIEDYSVSQVADDETSAKFVNKALDSFAGVKVNKAQVISKATELMSGGNPALWSPSNARITDFLSRDSKSESPQFSAPKGRNEVGFHRVEDQAAE